MLLEQLDFTTEGETKAHEEGWTITLGRMAQVVQSRATGYSSYTWPKSGDCHEEERMYTGVSIFLIAVGAILTFAVNASISGLDINVVGIILMVVGVIGLIVDLAIWAPRRRRVATGGTVVNERRYYEDPTV